MLYHVAPILNFRLSNYMLHWRYFDILWISYLRWETEMEMMGQQKAFSVNHTNCAIFLQLRSKFKGREELTSEAWRISSLASRKQQM